MDVITNNLAPSMVAGQGELYRDWLHGFHPYRPFPEAFSHDSLFTNNYALKIDLRDVRFSEL